MTRVALATHNLHKLEEFRQIIGETFHGVHVEAYDGPEPQETGLSFEEIALIKARAAAEFTRQPSLADDSGICVDALGGMPGVFSAYWAGHRKDDDANLGLLLDQLSDIVEPQRRRAHYVAVLAFVVPGETGGQEFVVRGEWDGTLTLEPRGLGGFGYDPIFVPEGEKRTAAELTAEEKSAISHRRRAFTLLMPLLAEHLGLS